MNRNLKQAKQASIEGKISVPAAPDAQEKRTAGGITIRRAAESDVPKMLEIYAPYIQNTTYSFEYTVPSLEEFTNRFCEITSFYPWFAAVANGTVVGYAYGSRMFERAAYQWDADVSIYIDARWHGLHIGTMLYDTLDISM